MDVYIQSSGMDMMICRGCGLLLTEATTEILGGDSDILFQDEDVCVLKPNSNRGIIVWHRFDAQFKQQIGEQGLILGNGVRILHPFHFFRAPMRLISPQTSLEDMNASYAHQVNASELEQYFCIRVDPETTFVYLSESRTSGLRWQESRMTLKRFWNVIEKNNEIKVPGQVPMYHVLSGEKIYTKHNSPLFTRVPTERNGEILVACKQIPPDWRIHLK